MDTLESLFVLITLKYLENYIHISQLILFKMYCCLYHTIVHQLVIHFPSINFIKAMQIIIKKSNKRNMVMETSPDGIHLFS